MPRKQTGRTWNGITRDKISDIIGCLKDKVNQGESVYLRIISKNHGSFYCSLDTELMKIENPDGIYFEKRRLGNNEAATFISMSDITEISIC